MLLEEDLPQPWTLGTSVWPDGSALDEALVQVQALSDADKRYLDGEGSWEPATERANVALNSSWSEIRNREDGRRVFIRMQRPLDRPGALVSGVIVLPPEPGHRVTAADMREVPIATIEASADARQYESAVVTRLELALGPQFDPSSPLGSPRADEHFYEKVAVQFAGLRAAGEPNVARQMAELNGKPVSTIHNWLAETRRRGYLAAGKRGRAL